jgi:pimeloyl-ACP methyl ester carboxylesterase
MVKAERNSSFRTEESEAAMTAKGIRPYRIEVSDEALRDLNERLDRAIWPNELPGANGYGQSNDRVRALATYWRNEFDWRALEAKLNAYPQFVADIDGESIHFLHVLSPREDATPLLLTHGWPGSIVEFLDVIEPLTNPSEPEAPAFHLVIPSLPGYGFSGPTHSPGWSRYRTAAAWVELMARLGYERYGVAGNDAGSMVGPEIGRLAPDAAIGIHVTQIFSFPSGDPAEFEGLSEADTKGVAHLQWFWENLGAFNVLHSQQPQTIAFALADSPVGLLAWNSQLFGEDLDDEFVVANVAIYWLTGTSASAIRMYYEDAHAGINEAERGPTTVPIGLAMFPGDFQSIRRFAERDHTKIVSWNAHEGGGHYSAHQATDALVGDMRKFFASLK